VSARVETEQLCWLCRLRRLINTIQLLWLSRREAKLSSRFWNVHTKKSRLQDQRDNGEW
jgi:hypothetical protein